LAMCTRESNVRKKPKNSYFSKLPPQVWLKPPSEDLAKINTGIQNFAKSSEEAFQNVQIEEHQ